MIRISEIMSSFEFLVPIIDLDSVTFIIIYYLFFQGVNHLLHFSFFLQYINKTGLRACVKQLFVNQHDPLSVSYVIMPGKITKKDRFNYETLLEWLLCCYG